MRDSKRRLCDVCLSFCVCYFRALRIRSLRATMAIGDRPDRTRLVLKCAVASRILLLTLIFLWRSIVDPYDTSALINPSCLPSSSPNGSDSDPSGNDSPLWPSIGSKIEGSIVWDGVYFTRIAQCGYEYEQTYAFLPLFPICMRVLSRTVFRPLVPLIGLRAVLGLSGYLLNIVAFALAAVYMYKLSLRILKDSEASLRAAILFCFNPASIFYSSIYSESLYSLLSVGGIYHLLSGENNLAVTLLALSGSVRSNGILNAGYVCFETLHGTYVALIHRKSALMVITFLVLGVLRSICIFVPFVAFQAYGYYNICLGRKPDEMSPWCSARVPLLYNYIQSHYWGVGFLRYFQLKQLPNFLLASPILSLAICSIVHFVRLRPSLFTSLGFKASNEEKSELFSSTSDQRLKIDSPSESSAFTIHQENQYLRKRKIVGGMGTKATSIDYEVSMLSGCCPILLVPFTLHLAFLVVTAIFVMHVQVSTRFLSASPPLYWFASHVMISADAASKRWASLIWTYSAAYIFLGSLLFSNFYPFT
uniref:GPI mannosyltransferase 2 n=1 Tax=Kalanchoe fedtschenkoi TaxID=63787 RepID=A0A7N0UPG1_KALFE